MNSHLKKVYGIEILYIDASHICNTRIDRRYADNHNMGGMFNGS